jgi:hypothetical protein
MTVQLVDEEALEAEVKVKILANWRHFIAGGFRYSRFTENLYEFLAHYCAFTDQHRRRAFWTYHFNAEAVRLRLFLNQFSGNGCSAEFNTHAWLEGPAGDLKQAMCQEMAQLYTPLQQVLEDLELRHAELGQAWREFALGHSPGSQDTALASGGPDPGYPPHYLVSENTRNLLAYAAQIALDDYRQEKNQ